MDQSVMAGIAISIVQKSYGAKIHPQTPGRAITRKNSIEFGMMQRLLEIGMKHNTIITVDGTPPSRSRYRERVNIFAKDNCPDCYETINRFEINGRRAFVCENCQPLIAEIPKQKPNLKPTNIKLT